ncbi:hypothetical protein EAO82_20550 [Halopseudomonas pelagia]|uniref:Uncharacterized protein n=1 Tax=Halopseudomonas pelagia TaxID=553151 RepID=A0AA91U1S0_9GAMM|nr:hypothetical protein CO192_12935 [Halopseudomonas pelagia]QFY58533.1 hypothetical protein EAO82_20550 [Halopseudomonas pelagia]
MESFARTPQKGPKKGHLFALLVKPIEYWSFTMAKDCEAAKIIEEQLIEVYGLLLTRKQLAEVLQRRIGGLNWELGRHDSALRRALGR